MYSFLANRIFLDLWGQYRECNKHLDWKKLLNVYINVLRQKRNESTWVAGYSLNHKNIATKARTLIFRIFYSTANLASFLIWCASKLFSLNAHISVYSNYSFRKSESKVYCLYSHLNGYEQILKMWRQTVFVSLNWTQI